MLEGRSGRSCSSRLWRLASSLTYHDPVCSKAGADEAAARGSGAWRRRSQRVSVTVRRIARPDRNWNWELASINPVPSGHGLAQARRAILPLQFAFDLLGLGVQDPEARDLTAIANVT